MPVGMWPPERRKLFLLVLRNTCNPWWWSRLRIKRKNNVYSGENWFCSGNRKRKVWCQIEQKQLFWSTRQKWFDCRITRERGIIF